MRKAVNTLWTDVKLLSYSCHVRAYEHRDTKHLHQ